MVRKILPYAEIYVYQDDSAKQIIGFIGLNGNYIEGVFVKETMQSKGNTLADKLYWLKRESAFLGLILCYSTKNGNYKDLILYYGCVLQKLILLY